MSRFWLPFNHATVLAAVPDWSGVYLIRAGGRIVQVGEAGDLRAELTALLNGDEPELASLLAEDAEFAVEFHLGEATRKRREHDLIARHRPAANDQAA
jgi:excinuclease UvrABC nuclease subunit